MNSTVMNMEKQKGSKPTPTVDYIRVWTIKEITSINFFVINFSPLIKNVGFYNPWVK